MTARTHGLRSRAVKLVAAAALATGAGLGIGAVATTHTVLADSVCVVGVPSCVVTPMITVSPTCQVGAGSASVTWAGVYWTGPSGSCTL